ncbi:hypothetical protein EJ08DRAFT_597888 [Tothia fuscella]|uniref:Uncharacterized protein n=1 Tax=Tothia fuscella TaxID=1048955 RepID=A0A9P4NHA9_9PEZI|nr:hypothetical protein EJ08DRAFT_597888 [Tothia fuscella]
MNYANMIEEKNLKKTFIIATLVSTIIGTFTTGLGLYERVGAKHKQKKLDDGQTEKIKKLEAEMKKLEESSKKPAPKQIEDGHVKDSLGASGPLIRREYDRDFAQLGPRFAHGDAITQTQLQGQVITLQSTVIGLLEDALYTGRVADINKLYNASELAREGSIAALQGQAQRLLQAAPIKRPLMQSMRRISSTPTLAIARSQHPQQLQKQKTLPPVSTQGAMTVYAGNDAYDSDPDAPLFCKYSTELQKDNSMKLHGSFGPGGANECPTCKVRLSTQQGRAWKIVKEIVHERISTPEYDDEVIEERTFLIGNRFVVKCHREKEGFACLLCFKHREKDTLLDSAQGLVRHVWMKHDVEEYKDVDIKEVG